MSSNQETLARMFAMTVVEQARRGPQPSLFEQLMDAIEDAIAEARKRRDALQPGTQAYLQVNEQITRWESAWRNNR